LTTWTNAKINAVYPNAIGKYWEITYVITGVTGDTGGTLTPKGIKKIHNVIVTAYKSDGSAAAAALTWRLNSGTLPTTVTVAYTNPAAAHTVRITVQGLRG